MADLFVGIDVAIAYRKALPVSILEQGSRGVRVIPGKKLLSRPPLGPGNKRALSDEVRKDYAASVRQWLCEAEEVLNGRIVRIAIDAPRDFANEAAGRCARRAAERELDRLGISVFTTPTRSRFSHIVALAHAHIDAGKAVAKLPHANQIWMLIGFELFRELEQTYDCREVYPQAIIRKLGLGKAYKTSRHGHVEQLSAVGSRLGIESSELSLALPQSGYGARHDKLDALMSAWVASLPDEQCEHYGTLPDDVIWVPKL